MQWQEGTFFFRLPPFSLLPSLLVPGDPFSKEPFSLILPLAHIFLAPISSLSRLLLLFWREGSCCCCWLVVQAQRGIIRLFCDATAIVVIPSSLFLEGIAATMVPLGQRLLLRASITGTQRNDRKLCSWNTFFLSYSAASNEFSPFPLLRNIYSFCHELLLESNPQSPFA